HIHTHPSPTRRSSDLKNIEDFSHNETRFGIIAPVNVAMEAVMKNFPTRPKLSCCVELDPETVEFPNFVAATLGRHNAKVTNIIPDRKSTRLNSSHVKR